jgi:hypothetical protein
MFTAEIPLPPFGLYATSVDFVAAMAGFEQCSGAVNDENNNNSVDVTTTTTPPTSLLPSSSPPPTEAQPDDDAAPLVEFEGSAQFVLTVPRDALAGDGAWGVTRLEVPSNPNTPVQSVIVSPIESIGDTHLFVDRTAQEACCSATLGCTAVSVVLATAGLPGSGCVSMQFSLADRMTGAGLPAWTYLSAPTHIALARRGAAGTPPVGLRHIHGVYGVVGAVDETCTPTVLRSSMGNMNMGKRRSADGTPDQAQALVWATVVVDPSAEYKVSATACVFFALCTSTILFNPPLAFVIVVRSAFCVIFFSQNNCRTN